MPRCYRRVGASRGSTATQADTEISPRRSRRTRSSEVNLSKNLRVLRTTIVRICVACANDREAERTRSRNFLSPRRKVAREGYKLLPMILPVISDLCGLCVPSTSLRTCFAGDIPKFGCGIAAALRGERVLSRLLNNLGYGTMRRGYFFPNFKRSTALCTNDGSRKGLASRFLIPCGLKRS